MAIARNERTRAPVQTPPQARTAYDIGERVTIRDSATGGVCGRGRVATFICDDEGYAYVVVGEAPFHGSLFFCRESELERD